MGLALSFLALLSRIKNDRMKEWNSLLGKAILSHFSHVKFRILLHLPHMLWLWKKEKHWDAVFFHFYSSTINLPNLPLATVTPSVGKNHYISFIISYWPSCKTHSEYPRILCAIWVIFLCSKAGGCLFRD